MNQRYKLDGFAQTRDALAWVTLSAPKLKFGLTFDEVQTAFEGGYDSVAKKLHDAPRLHQLEESRRKMRHAIALLKSGDEAKGTRAMQEAQELFTTLRRIGGRTPTRQGLGQTERGGNEVDE